MKCDKVGYDKEWQAKQFANICRQRGQRMSTYYCKGCEQYHLTKNKKKGK